MVQSSCIAGVGTESHDPIRSFLDVSSSQLTLLVSSSLGNSLPSGKELHSSTGVPSRALFQALPWHLGLTVSTVTLAAAASAGGECNCNHFLPQLVLGLAPPLRTVRAGPRYQEGVQLGWELPSGATLKGNQLRLIITGGGGCPQF